MTSQCQEHTMKSLNGKTVLIIGGSSGIGLATAHLASQEGARVIISSRSPEKLVEAAKSIPNKVETQAVDMLDEQAVRALAKAIGQIDHIVLTAVADENKRRAPVAKLETEQMERSLDKLRGFFFIVRAFAPMMIERGSITILSGGSALRPPREGMSILASVNAAVATFAHALALELAPVRVNAVTPGVVDTPVWSVDARNEIKQWAESPDLPAQRFGTPDDLAHAILFLMTNPYMTGHNLVVDGGLVAK
jgi:NAD(P)-dependent dehydrogenase (short-subunit alcohol dehydrogenase family)